GDPPFLLEPRNPPEYPSYFLESGFETLATYTSSALPLSGKAPDLSRALARLTRRNITIRDLNPDHFAAELSAIYDVCLASFSGNFLYTPITSREFVHSYSRVEPCLDPSFVRIAEREGEVIGFLFALPDPAAGPSGGNRVILKTLAVAPRHRSAGLGSILVAQVQERARRKGFSEAIHAMQHESNSSRRITERYQSRLIRRYALYHGRCDP
ncbi:MAG: GNAT family N-acetyltransferase, partial [Akkermansiaceae bacterium]|nr:GNAT family N-acetyltransferase [Akkermansiaceae bacterium]